MRHFVVNYQLRKGMGPDWIDKEFYTCFDDVDPETEDWELRQWARNEFEG